MSAAVRLCAVATIVALAHCDVHNNGLVSLNQVKASEAPFKACIDDSDCGDKCMAWFGSKKECIKKNHLK